ncbi:hypothetical protein KC19_10G118700 [Ceratodon purpureus]|uniref:Uncharacterized protein n=1 Tax=Ceratodon purpureus TaxID=3225 RepID=A0A8T0GN06_CERPU|nr:hypothetical protein KC19_10G118700 [Ceratodon purpureus]
MPLVSMFSLAVPAFCLCLHTGLKKRHISFGININNFEDGILMCLNTFDCYKSEHTEL